MSFEEWYKWKQINGEFEENLLKEWYLTDNINFLKKDLSFTDYKAIKYSEGLYTDEEYEPIKKQRQELRDEINKLQKELDKICNKDKEK